MESELDIAYGPDAKHRWDLYLPSRLDASFVVVFVHGGAWRSGDKLEHGVLAANLVQETGCPVAVPNYRLSPRVASSESLRHPEHAHDVSRALSSIRKHPRLAEIPRMALVGHSCGAHIISSLLLQPPNDVEESTEPTLSQDVLDVVTSVALAEGIYDLDVLLETYPTYRDFVEGAFQSESGSFARYSVSKQYSTPPGMATDWLVIHSRGDSLVNVEQAEDMYTHLQSQYSLNRSDQSKVTKSTTKLTEDHDEVLLNAEFARLIKGLIERRGYEISS